MNEFPSLKNSLEGVRVGTTSYILPDEIVPNVEFLAPHVDDVELVIFESPDGCNLPAPAEVDVLRAFRDEFGLTYTVHLPIDVSLTAASGRDRERALDSCRRIMEHLNKLDPHRYIVHLDGERSGSFGEWGDWMLRAVDSVEVLAGSCRGPEALALENLDYPFELLLDVSRETGASLCGDVGHVLLHGFSLADFADRFLPRASVVHVHGVEGGVDHKALSPCDEEAFETVLRAVSASPHETVLTVEVFGLEDFLKSFRFLGRVLGWER